MKKVYHIFAFIALAIAFTACHKTNQAPVPKPPVTPKPQNVTVTLNAADYALIGIKGQSVPNDYAYQKEAIGKVMNILDAKYPDYLDGSTAVVTYAISPVTITVADTVLSHVAETLSTPDDYNDDVAYFRYSGKRAIVSWADSKYLDLAGHKLVLATYDYLDEGVIKHTTESVLYIHDPNADSPSSENHWALIYTVSPAQYTSVGKEALNGFGPSDNAQLPAYFNTFLKDDPGVTSVEKSGDIQYVSFRYTNGSAFQRVLPLTFNGTDWTTKPTPATTTFYRVKGKWTDDNTISLTLGTADYTYIATKTTAGSADARADLAKNKYFSTKLTTSINWSDADVQAALIALLKNSYPTPYNNQEFILTYKVKPGKSATQSVVQKFKYDGTAFKPEV